MRAKGGQGSLWRGPYRLGNPVAVRVCDLALAAGALQRQRFLDEGYIRNKITSELSEAA